HREKDFQSFGESSGGIVRKKGAYCGQQECGLCRVVAEQTARYVGAKEARPEIDKDLYEQNGAVVVHAENREYKRKKARIPRQSNVCRGNLIGAAQAIDAVL